MTEHLLHRPSFPSLKYTKCVSGRGSATPPYPLAGLEGGGGDKEEGELVKEGRETEGKGE